MNKKTKKLTLILIVVLVILAFFLTPKLLDSLPKHFSISSDANFYGCSTNPVGEKSPTGFFICKKEKSRL